MDKKRFNFIKFEKINMKLVIGIGLIIIFILTMIFIVFRTNLIVDRGGNKNKDKNNSINKGTNNGNIENPNNNGNTENPDYSDPNDDEKITGTISEAAKNRTKDAKILTKTEKLYIIEENIKKLLTKNVSEEYKINCTKNGVATKKGNCYRLAEAEENSFYSTESGSGYMISGCTGKVYYEYDETKKEYIFDLSKVECK